MSKKIGIVTVHFYHNYGSMLQAFATQYAIEKHCNCIAEIIDCCPPGMFYATQNAYDYNHPSDFHFTQLIHGSRKSIKGKLIYIYKYKLFRQFLWHIKNIQGDKVDYRNFTSFRKNFHLSKYHYKTENLYDNPPIYDAYVVASDQVWNAYITYNNPVYFLTFVRNKAIKLAYAPSIGLPEIPSHVKEYFVKGLKNLDFLSSREKESAELISKLSGKKALHVLDPTLLLNKNEWEVFADKEKIGRNYVLTYFLQPTEYMYKLSQKVANDLNLPIIHIGGDEKSIEGNATYSGPISVEKWLRLFMDASIVVTNSFHGMAFSANFNRPFITTLRWKDSKTSMNARHRSFIDQFNFHQQFFKEGKFPEMKNYTIDYSLINQQLEEERRKSLSYLSHINDSLS
ncbi:MULTISPECIES: polysaccharide pyruvyl transferase family protein [unclassified Bacteroides]|uniref:polysaccharide pyruvyl transferase family protein n=1 Tax=unclassified Bacteroides TaxID=2646097 RepID=UPI000E802BFD|nr:MULTISPECIES: polysaccharide pyruvyl transferase family protein [unclassified Bacteroides]RGN48684.1 polysaccharide pyruvyl transferase family protein [Bacteroides sp. OM05-12]RHR75647.1 polysaccharide pyruvyl transferase family protein [Bacteroides sp. AF16-49]